jgi:glycosyltransferase involved in cell wall biosynthesis
VLNHGLFTERLPEVPRHGGTHCVFVGALESRKGAVLAIKSLLYTPSDVSLEIVGDGPERDRLTALASRLGLSNRIRFHGRVDRETLSRHLSGAAAAVFTGLREEGGLALAETLLAGVPVVILANGGALTIAAAATNPSLIRFVDPGTVEGTARALGLAMTDLVRSPGAGGQPLLDEQAAHDALREALHRTLSSMAPVV